MERWKTHLFGLEEKLDNRKCCLYKFTLMPLSHNIRNNFFVITKNIYINFFFFPLYYVIYIFCIQGESHHLI